MDRLSRRTLERFSEITAIRRDGTFVCGGILGAAFDPEVKAHLEAERAPKEELRNQPNVVLLEDWRQSD